MTKTTFSPHIVEGPNHAMRTGMLLGILVKQGVDVQEEYDEDGNYAASLLITLPESAPTSLRTLRIVVEASGEDE